MGQARSTLAVARILILIEPARVMQKSEELDDGLMRTRDLRKSQAIGPDPGPVRAPCMPCQSSAKCLRRCAISGRVSMKGLQAPWEFLNFASASWGAAHPGSAPRASLAVRGIRIRLALGALPPQERRGGCAPVQ